MIYIRYLRYIVKFVWIILEIFIFIFLLNFGWNCIILYYCRLLLEKGYDVMYDDYFLRGFKLMYFIFEIIKWNIFIMYE